MAQQGEAQQAGQETRRLSGGMIASLIGLAVLLIFIIQNRMRIKITFLAWHFTWPLWVYTIVIALFGALAWFGMGVIRRHRRRKERRENRRD
ncbi:MAG TPA: lipopolysaccharide assembly protein LapA domain-containing protein [Trebonia sp.]|nr:lipopolysaccharide assembly protein LapA domain-containing protein [Trebonia sp.]